jgi:hypothetical protein
VTLTAVARVLDAVDGRGSLGADYGMEVDAF